MFSIYASTTRPPIRGRYRQRASVRDGHGIEAVFSRYLLYLCSDLKENHTVEFRELFFTSERVDYLCDLKFLREFGVPRL